MQDQVAEHRYIVIPGNELFALRTVRPGPADRHTLRKAQNNNVQKTANDQPKQKRAKRDHAPNVPQPPEADNVWFAAPGANR